MMEGFEFLHEKRHVGSAGKYKHPICGRVSKTGDRKYYVVCYFTKDIADKFSDEKKGFLFGIKDGKYYLVYTKDGYMMTGNGKRSIKKAVQVILFETEKNKAFLESFDGKMFNGDIVDDNAILLSMME